MGLGVGLVMLGRISKVWNIYVICVYIVSIFVKKNILIKNCTIAVYGGY